MAAGENDEVLEDACAEGGESTEAVCAATIGLATVVTHIDDIDVLLVLMSVNRTLRGLLRDRGRTNGTWRKALRTLADKAAGTRRYHPNVEALQLLFWHEFRPQISWVDIALPLHRQFVVLALNPAGLGFTLYKVCTKEVLKSANGDVVLVIGPIADPVLVLKLLLIYKGMHPLHHSERLSMKGVPVFDHPYDCATMLYKFADTHELPHQAPVNTEKSQEAQRYIFSPENWHTKYFQDFVLHGMRMLEKARGHVR